MLDFTRPMALWLLLIVPGLAWVVARGRRRRSREWAALGHGGRPPRDAARSWLAALTLLLVALAGPRWGRPNAAGSPGHDVVLLVDVSRSMAARDAVPDRLGAAVEAAGEILKALGADPGHRAAVVAFAGRGVLRCPLTENLGAAIDILRGLRPGDLRPGGTDLAAGLDAALDAFGLEEPAAAGRSIVVLSDGEDLAGSWQRVATRLKEAAVAVHAVTVGDDAPPGQPVPMPDGRELAYEGQPVRSRRQDEPLAALTRATGGAFIPLGLAQPGGLDTLLARQLDETTRAAVRRGGRAERYPVFVLAALGAGLIGSWPQRRGVLLAALGVMVATGAGPEADDALRRGLAADALGRSEEALTWFEEASRRNPRSALAPYNAAAVLFRMGRYDEALSRYRAAREQAGDRLRTKIDFALGNTAYALGDVPAALRHYEACLASTAPGAEAAAMRRDAGINRDFVAQLPPEPTSRGEAPESPSSASGGPPPGDLTTDPSSPPDAPPPEGAAATEATRPGRTSKGEAKSPGERLGEALSHARDARRRRLAHEPPAPADADRRDW